METSTNTSHNPAPGHAQTTFTAEPVATDSSLAPPDDHHTTHSQVQPKTKSKPLPPPKPLKPNKTVTTNPFLARTDFSTSHDPSFTISTSSFTKTNPFASSTNKNLPFNLHTDHLFLPITTLNPNPASLPSPPPLPPREHSFSDLDGTASTPALHLPPVPARDPNLFLHSSVSAANNSSFPPKRDTVGIIKRNTYAETMQERSRSTSASLPRRNSTDTESDGITSSPSYSSAFTKAAKNISSNAATVEDTTFLPVAACNGSATASSTVADTEKESVYLSFTADTLDKLYPVEKVELDWSKYTERRHKIAYEILTTEQNYVRTLQTLVYFYQPVMEEAFEEEENTTVKANINIIRSVFLHIQDILNVNHLLLLNLTKRMKEWSETQEIGDVFISIGPFLKMYQSYIKVYDEASNAIHEADQKSRTFGGWMEKLQTHPLSKSQLLSGFLIQPVQRVPRYVLLLSDLIANTPETHPDYENLLLSLNTMKSVAIFINEAVHAAENQSKCLQIQKQFGGSITIVEAHRKFIKEGLLLKQCRKERKMRRIFLFTDIMVYGFDVTGMTHTKLSQKLELETMVVEPALDNESIEHAIVIQSPGKSFYLFAKTAEERDDWLATLNKAIEEEVRRIQTIKGKEVGTLLSAAPVWDPDDSSEKCPFCSEKFSFYFRKHHCRNCGSVVCGNCSTHKLLIRKSKVRVCDTCYETLSDTCKT